MLSSLTKPRLFVIFLQQYNTDFLASAVFCYLYNAGYVTKNAPSASEQPMNTGFQWLSQKLWPCFRMVNTMLTQSLQEILMIIHLPVMLNLLFGISSHRCGITNPSSIFSPKFCTIPRVTPWVCFLSADCISTSHTPHQRGKEEGPAGKAEKLPF